MATLIMHLVTMAIDGDNFRLEQQCTRVLTGGLQ